MESVARALAMPYKVLGLEDPRELDAALRDVTVLINAAGPFEITARPIVEACLRTGTHYLDVTGDLPVVRYLHGLDPAAREADVMIMPAAGFVVVASDCLAAHVAARLPDAQYLWLGFSRGDTISRGSFTSMLGLIGRDVTIRRDGRLCTVPMGKLERAFDYGGGDSLSIAVPWPDPFTAHYTTKIPNIEGYLEADLCMRSASQMFAFFGAPLRLTPVRSLLTLMAQALPEGPSEVQRAATPKVIVAEVEDRYRRRVRARLHTPNVYTFTAVAALAIAQRVLEGEARAGFQTPAAVYGPDFILGFEGVRREEITERC
jgi:short subunit dehydrogenase-like uncharacterized protein